MTEINIPTSPSEPGFAITLELAPRVSFATHQSDLPILVALIVANRTDHAAETLTLRLTAEPPVFAEKSWTLDRLDPGAEIHIGDRRLRLDGGWLHELTERMRADITVELMQGETVLAREETDIEALARNQWGGTVVAPELLAAFVLPNDPVIARLLKDTSRALEAQGLPSSLEGYQARSRQRCWALMAAVWAVVCQRRITYAEPPASFESTGQKLRTPGDIETQGLATCLDTSLLFAAAAEQIGLNPVVVLVQGHAFAGVWLQPQTLAAPLTDEPSELRKACDQHELILFETTLATGPTPGSFSQAIAAARHRIDEARDAEFRLALDIKQARARGIRPLPQHDAAGAGAPEPAGDPAIAIEAPPALPGVDLGLGPEVAPETPAERVEQWKRKLLDLSKRNRLLNLQSSATTIALFCPDPAALEDRIASGQRISIIAPPTPSSATPDATIRMPRTGDERDDQNAHAALEHNQVIALAEPRVLERGLLELFRKSDADFREGGSNTLFLALGTLKWRPTGETLRWYRAPLILLPVRLERASAASALRLSRHDDDPVFNQTLLELLRQEFHIDIAGLRGELPTDTSGIDVPRVLARVRQAVREVPGFEVMTEVTLSTFSFAKYLMWKDLADHLEALKGSPFVRHLIDDPKAPYTGSASFIEPREIDTKIDPGALFAPLNADGSQLVAIHASGGDGDFVLEGPPGTGKSETVANIIAHNLALGHKVLFVSEKMAALKAVSDRLRKCGLGRFCLELHSNKSGKKEVLAQLDSAWRREGSGGAIDWARRAEALREVRDQLNQLPEVLHRPGPAGISPRQAIGRIAACGRVHTLALDWEQDLDSQGGAPSPEAFDAASETARQLGMAAKEVTETDRDGFAPIGQAQWSHGWALGIAEAAAGFTTALVALRQTRAAFAAAIGLPDTDGRAASEALGALAQALPRCAGADIGFALGADGAAALDALVAAAEALAANATAVAALPHPVAEAALLAAPLTGWVEARSGAEARYWPFRGRALNRLRREIEARLAWPRSPATDTALPLLIEAQTRAGAVQQALHTLPPGLATAGAATDPIRLATLAETGAVTRAALQRLARAGYDPAATRECLRRLVGEDRDLLQPGLPIASTAGAFSAALASFAAAHRAFSEDARLVDGDDLDACATAANAIVASPARLKPWCDWVMARDAAVALGLGRLVAALERGDVAPDDAAPAFRTAYCRWAAPLMIDRSEPLRRFSAAGYDALIATFRDRDRELARLTADYIAARLAAATPARDGARTPAALGVLARELQKKSRHLPVRKLIEQLGDSLLMLTPCLMMSPLSVAQYLPASQSMFDLVVFDEASQITVPDAIGAIARGRRVIIVGDPKQMPPTSFFDKAANEEENEADTADLESILDEALAARVALRRLTGHYRSRHESLIAFSNLTYYGGELVTYPAAVTQASQVSLRRVEGVYARGAARTNPIEAQALVAELVKRLRGGGEAPRSIGVVTLNSQQQRLIEDLLDAERRKDPELERFFDSSADEPVFVKNLETVQGDQRDVILISIGYGPTEPGAATMGMNFGPLNRAGGERRLNVAITRAAYEVVVFASFDPDMLDLSRTNATAVHHLKRYLDFARRGPTALGTAPDVSGAERYDSEFEFSVAEALRRRGWRITTQVGVSKFRIDLGVIHPDLPGRFLAGVECDGATWHSSPSARDRDRVRHVILELLGWQLLRLWSTDWFLDPTACLDRLDARLQALLEQDRAGRPVPDPNSTPVPPAPPRDRPPPANANTAAPAAPQPAAPEPAIAGADAPIRGYAGPSAPTHELDLMPDRFHDPSYAATLTRLIAHLQQTEGLVTLPRLARLVARRHGFHRTGARIEQTVRAATTGCITMGEDGVALVWPTGSEPGPMVPFRRAADGEEGRDWAEIPHPEKLGLAHDCLTADDPVRAMADTLGLTRLRASTRTEFEEAIVAIRRLLETQIKREETLPDTNRRN